MARFFWSVLFIIGLGLMTWGATTLDPSGEAFSVVFTGQAAPRAIGLLIGGFLTSLVGLAGVLRSSHS